MDIITGNTQGITNNAHEKNVYEKILKSSKENISWIKIYNSFEAFYYMCNSAISYYEEHELYEECNIIKNSLSNWINKIPKSKEDAVKFLMKSTPQSHKHLMSQRDTFSLAINMHKSTGMRIIDMWLLRYDESPLRKYYIREHKITNPDQIANDLLITYINATKATEEAR